MSNGEFNKSNCEWALVGDISSSKGLVQVVQNEIFADTLQGIDLRTRDERMQAEKEKIENQQEYIDQFATPQSTEQPRESSESTSNEGEEFGDELDFSDIGEQPRGKYSLIPKNEDSGSITAAIAELEQEVAATNVIYADYFRRVNPAEMTAYLKSCGDEYLQQIKPMATRYLQSEKARELYGIKGSKSEEKVRALYVAAIKASGEYEVIDKTHAEENSGVIVLAKLMAEEDQRAESRSSLAGVNK